jgi:antitoxin VapB
MAGVGITDAIVIAMREAIARHRDLETPRQTAARLRAKHGVILGDRAKAPLPKPTGSPTPLSQPNTA